MLRTKTLLCCSVAAYLLIAAPAFAQSSGSLQTQPEQTDSGAGTAPPAAAQAGGTALPSSPTGTDAGQSGALAPDGTPLQSAPANDGLEDIVVVAQKRSENIQRVPIAVTAVAPTQLVASGVTSVSDLPAAVPGLQVLNIANNVTPRLRGVGTGAAAAGIESAVATYVDGVYYAYGPDVNLDLSDVSQVSVLKGPQGTLFGRNATGGVLQITTRDPTQTFHADLATSIDNYATSRSDIYVAGGLTDNVAAGLSVQFTTQGKGWGTNIFDGQEIHKIKHAISARGKVIWNLGDNTDIKLQADYSDRAGPVGANFRPFPGYQSIFPAPQSNRLWDINSFYDTKNTYSGGGGSLIVDQDLGFAKLTSISAYRSSKLFFTFSPGVSSTPTLSLAIGERSSQFTQELQLVSPSGGPFTWAVGAFYFHNYAKQADQITFYPPLIDPFQFIDIPAVQKTDSIAGFAQATYTVADHTRITAGFRFTYEYKDFVGQDIGTFANGVSAVLVSRDESYSFKKPTWRISVDQDLAPDVIGYASYNRGVKSGGFNVREPANPPFAPERLDAYEVGLKTQLLERRVRANVAGFYYDYKNIQVPVFSQTLVIVNGAAARIWGIDGDFEAKAGDHLRLNFGASYLNTRWTSFPQAPFSIPNPGNAGATLVLGDAKGNKLPFSPTFTYTAGADYDIETNAGKFVLNVSDNYNSGFFSEADNRLKQRRYHLLNTSVRWTSADDRFNARLFVNNILNKAVAGQFVTQTVGYLADYSNPPRIYGAAIGVSF